MGGAVVQGWSKVVCWKSGDRGSSIRWHQFIRPTSITALSRYFRLPHSYKPKVYEQFDIA